MYGTTEEWKPTTTKSSSPKQEWNLEKAARLALASWPVAMMKLKNVPSRKEPQKK